MNILIICHYGLYQEFSSSFVHAQAEAYAALGHHVRVIVPIAVGKRDWDRKRLSVSLQRREEDGVELFLLRFLSLSNYGEKGFNVSSAIRVIRRHFRALLDDFTPNIIHAHTLGFDSSVGAWLKKQLHVPLVVTTHGSDTSVPVAQGRAASLKAYCDQADSVVAVSSALAGKLRSCGTQTPVSVILNGFHFRFLPEALGKDGITMLQAGHFSEQKRFHITIRSFAQIQKAHPEAALVLIGDGAKRRELENLCKKLGLEGSVRFTGQISNQAVLAKMGQARFFVMPSVNEGFGIVYLEAMACGCVVIGTEGEGIADLIVSGKNGFLVPPDNPYAIARTVEWCLTHPREAETVAERGHQAALELTWEKNAERYINLFEELVL